MKQAGSVSNTQIYLFPCGLTCVQALSDAHDASAQEGDTEVQYFAKWHCTHSLAYLNSSKNGVKIRLQFFLQPPAPEEDVNLHFIALIQRDGHLYELGLVTPIYK